MRLVLLTLVLAKFILAKDDWIIHNFNRNLIYPLKDATDNFIYVTFSLDDSQAIKLDFHDKRESCIVPRNLAYNSRNRQKVSILGNGKVVITMMNNQITRGRISDAINKLDWKLSIIDPKNCNYQHKVIGHFGKVFDDILPYIDTFDLDGKDNKVNKVVRFKDNGELEGFSANISDKKYLGIKIAKEYDPSAGYYYVVRNREESQLIIKKLNSQYQVTKTYIVKRENMSQDPQSYSVRHGRITFCYFTGSRINLECVVIDGELQRELLKIQLKYEDELSGTTIVNFKQGGFAVVHYNLDENQVSTVYARRVSDKGDIGQIVKIGEVDDAIYNVHIFVMNDGKLCIVVTTKDSVFNKCIDLK